MLVRRLNKEVPLMNKASVIEAIKLSGHLVLETPLRIGAGGDPDSTHETVDIKVLKDKLERPFIPGTSLAGVLRNWVAANYPNLLVEVFGDSLIPQRGTEERQSAITFSDIPLEKGSIALRDGVRLDEITGTAIDKAKYDFEVIERGATGHFVITLVLRKYQEQIKEDMELCMRHMADTFRTGIRLGSLTTKGFGVVKATQALVDCYDFSQPSAVKQWLKKESSSKAYEGKVGGAPTPSTFSVEVEASINGSLLVRDYDVPDSESTEASLSAMQLRAFRGTKDGGYDYVIPGSSIKGVLKHHAVYILRALKAKDSSFLDTLMGQANESASEGRKSRFIVDEVYFKDGVKAVNQTRTRIDRFTGGVMDSALFTNQPVWQEEKHKKTLTLRYEISDCKDSEAGLALLLLKDLCTGRIAFGGEKSIGRGTLKGLSAKISFKGQTYQFNEHGMVDNGQKQLEAYVKAFASLVKGGR